MVEQWSVVRTGEIPPLQVSDQWLVGLGPLLVVSGQIPHCALTNSGPWSTTGGQRSVEKFPRAGSDQWVVGVLRPPAHGWCFSLVGRDSGTRGASLRDGMPTVSGQIPHFTLTNGWSWLDKAPRLTVSE